MKSKLSRRRFMHGLATVGGAAFVGPSIMRAAEPNKEKLRIAYVAVGGRAEAHIGWAKREFCPCFAEVDQKRWTNKDAGKDMSKLAPDAKPYTDYRQMFDKHMNEIDAVFVASPDNHHAPASLRALRGKKAVYCEKPLTWSVEESRLMAEEAAKQQVATQMGNQGHANQGNRRIVEWVRGGLIGDVLEVHSWTNRPIWPQGIDHRPPTKPVPAGLDWETWIGPAPFREYHDGLHPFAWRGWFDFGCGAIGDMGCHTWDNVFWSMQPDYPSEVELIKIVSKASEMFPKQSQTKWTFPAKGGRPGFVAHWYEGGLKPAVPEEILNDPYYAPKPKKGPNGEEIKGAPYQFPGSGNLYIGTKGKLFVTGDYGDSPRLIPETFHESTKSQREKLPQIPKSIGHHEEFIAAAKGEKPWDFPGSNFAKYAGPLTEVMLLASIAIKIGEEGYKFECDPVARTIKTEKAKALASRPYRKGWEL